MKTLAIATLIAALSSTAMAQDVGKTTVAAGLSTFGGNLEAAYRIDPNYGVRGAFMGGIGFEYEESDVDGDFDGEFDLGGVALLGDYYPTQGQWRISGGLFFSTTELDASGTAEVEGQGIEAITTEARFNNEVAPMITTGYEARIAEDWTFNSEVGLIFIGGIDIDYTATDATVQADLDADQDVQDARDAADDVFALPYLSFTVGYQF